MAVEEIRTYKDMQDAVIDRGKLEDNSSVRATVKEKINTVYQEIAYKEFYTWSGATELLFLKKKYTTGTITLTINTDTITGAATSWVENDHRFSRIKIPGSSVPYKILRVASATSITVDYPWIPASKSGSSYEIYKDEYGLFPDLQDVRKIMIPGLANNLQPRPIGPTEMDGYRSRVPFVGGLPKFYTVWGSNIFTQKTLATFNLNTDFWEDALDTEPRNKNLIIWPSLLTEDRPAIVRYTKIAHPMDADVDEPLIPTEHRAVLVWGTLSDHFSVNRDVVTRNIWESKYREMEADMAGDIDTVTDELVLQLDRRGFSATPRFSGFLSENEFDSL